MWLLIWRTRLGYEIRAFGHSQSAAVYAGINPTKIIMITMLISGGLAGMMAINVVMGEAERLVLDFVEGAGFVGIAVALMGRSHPVGVVLAALLFGALYQGGAELQFEMPAISREMVVVIQALVILFYRRARQHGAHADAGLLPVAPPPPRGAGPEQPGGMSADGPHPPVSPGTTLPIWPSPGSAFCRARSVSMNSRNGPNTS